MKKTIEWYDQGIYALKKFIKQHEIELEGFISQIESPIESQKKRIEIEKATGKDKTKYLYIEEEDEYNERNPEFSDIDSCIQKYLIRVGQDYPPSYYSVWRKAGSVRKRLIKDLETEKRTVSRRKRLEVTKEKYRLDALLTQRQKLMKKLELEGIKTPVLNLEQIESKIEQEINAGSLGVINLGIYDENLKYKPLIQFTKNMLTQFLKVIAEPDSIIKLIEAVGLSNVKDVIDKLYEITWKLGESGFICPSCQKIYIKEKMNICEVCGHDFMKI